MFGRQVFGHAFQPFGFSGPVQVPAINPFQQFNTGVSPFGFGSGFGVINPLVSPLSGFGTKTFATGQF